MVKSKMRIKLYNEDKHIWFDEWFVTQAWDGVDLYKSLVLNIYRDEKHKD